jgi:hypothetical protein
MSLPCWIAHTPCSPSPSATWRKLQVKPPSSSSPRRWVVERTLAAWIARHRRCVRDYERLPEHHESMVRWSMIRITVDGGSYDPGSVLGRGFSPGVDRPWRHTRFFFAARGRTALCPATIP